jgi:hypothetical protein
MQRPCNCFSRSTSLFRSAPSHLPRPLGGPLASPRERHREFATANFTQSAATVLTLLNCLQQENEPSEPVSGEGAPKISFGGDGRARQGTRVREGVGVQGSQGEHGYDGER